MATKSYTDPATGITFYYDPIIFNPQVDKAPAIPRSPSGLSEYANTKYWQGMLKSAPRKISQPGFFAGFEESGSPIWLYESPDPRAGKQTYYIPHKGPSENDIRWFQKFFDQVRKDIPNVVIDSTEGIKKLEETPTLGNYFPIMPGVNAKYDSNKGFYFYYKDDKNAKVILPPGKDTEAFVQAIKENYESGQSALWIPADIAVQAPDAPNLHRGWRGEMGKYMPAVFGGLVGVLTLNPALGAAAGGLTGAAMSAAKEADAKGWFRNILSGAAAGYGAGSLSSFVYSKIAEAPLAAEAITTATSNAPAVSNTVTPLYGPGSIAEANQAFAQGYGQALQSAINTTGGSVLGQTVPENFLSTLSGAAPAVTAAAGAGANAVTGLLSNIGDTASNVLSAGGELLDNILPSGDNVLGSIISGGSDLLGGLLSNERIGGAISDLLTSGVEGYFNYRGLDAIRDAISKGRDDVETWTNRGLAYLEPYLHQDPRNDPYMQAALADITNRVQSSAAARGMLHSGQTLQNIADTSLARAYIPYRGQNIGLAQTASGLATGAGGNLATLAGDAGRATAGWWSGLAGNLGATVQHATQPSTAERMEQILGGLRDIMSIFNGANTGPQNEES